MLFKAQLKNQNKLKPKVGSDTTPVHMWRENKAKEIQNTGQNLNIMKFI